MVREHFVPENVYDSKGNGLQTIVMNSVGDGPVSRTRMRPGFQMQMDDDFIGLVFNFSMTASEWITFGMIPSIITKIFIFLTLTIGVIGCFVLQEEWKRVLIATLLLIGLPAISAVYAGIFMMIPLIYFLDHEKRKSRVNFIYLLLMTSTMVLIPFSGWHHLGDRMHYKAAINLSTAVESTAILMLTLMLLAEVVWLIFVKFRERLKKKKMQGGEINIHATEK